MKDPSPIGDDSDSVVLKKVGYESFVLRRQFDMNLDNFYMNDPIKVEKVLQKDQKKDLESQKSTKK